jgi:hypothetical protein
VFAIGIYLFVQVHASPARADGGGGGHREASASSETTRVPPPLAADSPVPSPTQRIAQIDLHRPTLAHTDEAGTDVPPPPAINARVTPSLQPGKTANPKFEAVMMEASKAYDRGDIDEAREIAKKVLADSPGNIRMLRILVSTSCMDSDAAAAKLYYASLPAVDQAQMRTRCERYGVTFGDPAPAAPPTQ